MRPDFGDFEWTCPSRLAALAHNEVLWRHYLATAVLFDGPDGRGVVRPVEHGTGENSPPLGALHVITAIQPDSDPGSHDSAARMRVLDDELADARLRALPVAGESRASTAATAKTAVPCSASTTREPVCGSGDLGRSPSSVGAVRSGRCWPVGMTGQLGVDGDGSRAPRRTTPGGLPCRF